MRALRDIEYFELGKSQNNENKPRTGTLSVAPPSRVRRTYTYRKPADKCHCNLISVIAISPLNLCHLSAGKGTQRFRAS